ncbi:hypothetical protein Syun_031517 [Stephania yunnanensis]|uniref:Uncharacterized protein n=1 Tax=Stephania yunnanensis TaxID=152371 RepID=A0AAP0E8I0_9MAGN
MWKAEKDLFTCLTNSQVASASERLAYLIKTEGLATSTRYARIFSDLAGKDNGSGGKEGRLEVAECVPMTWRS